MKSQVCNQPVAHQHECHYTNINPKPVQPDGFNSRKIHHPTKLPFSTLINVVVFVLHTQQKLVAIVAVAEILEPHNKRRDLLNVVSTRNEENEGGDRGERCGLLDVHENGTEGQAETLRDKDAVEDDEEGEEEGRRVGIETTHEVDNEDKGRGKCEF